jgi:hypothetical protein
VARWLREPLLHFLVIGLAMFLVYRALNGAETAAPRRIEVSESRVDALAENFAKTWMRPPTAAELKGLVDDYVAEEVYYREAIAIGLDRDDTVIRRRLRQKMEFVTDDAVGSESATDAQLQAYLDTHRQAFVTPGTVTFEQVFVSPDQRGASAQQDAQRILGQLQSGTSTGLPADLGDPTLLPGSMQSATPQDVDNAFGAEFTQDVMRAPPGAWIGPLKSGYGLHLVRVSSIEAGSLPPLAQIRPAVEREWQAEQRRLAKDALLKQLLSKYDVRIEGPLGEALRKAGRQQPAAAAP